MNTNKTSQKISCFIGRVTALILASGLALSTATGANAADLVVYGASGNFGSDIVTEALSRGHNVIGVSRSPENLTVDHPNFTAVKIDDFFDN